MEIKDNILTGESITIQETPNISGNFRQGLPDTIVIHYTAGSSAQSSANWLCNPDAKASAHLVIGKKGEVIQLAPFNIRTWHAGTSAWEARTYLNQYSIGIEIDNAGRLEKRVNGYYTYFGTKVKDDLVVEAIHRNEETASYWQAYTPEQIEVTEKICRLLKEKYNIGYILGHEEIAPKRKTDPGPAFPLDKIRERILFADRGDNSLEEDELQTELKTKGLVTANSLNIRFQPSISSSTVSQPLKKGTLVEVIEEKNGWYKVRNTTEGWVSGRYLKV